MDDPQTFQQLHAMVEGHVQGVGYRFFVVQQAQILGLLGWVRNTWDGKVEVKAEGKRADLETLLQQLHTGPRSAIVFHIDVDWQPASNSFKTFSIVY
jgi:acylphosphatase